jgi:hypothetical protein
MEGHLIIRTSSTKNGWHGYITSPFYLVKTTKNHLIGYDHMTYKLIKEGFKEEYKHIHILNSEYWLDDKWMYYNKLIPQKKSIK